MEPAKKTSTRYKYFLKRGIAIFLDKRSIIHKPTVSQTQGLHVYRHANLYME